MPHPYPTDDPVDELWLVRHGETEWSRTGKHTSTTDLPLTEEGVRVAATLRDRLAGVAFDLVLTSPRQRARRTAELAGFPDAEVDDDLAEWDYGDYEGITTPEIRETVPGWTVWSHPSPRGETAGAGLRAARPRRRPGPGAGWPVRWLRARARAACAHRTLAGAAGRGGPALPARHLDRLGARPTSARRRSSSAGTPERR